MNIFLETHKLSKQGETTINYDPETNAPEELVKLMREVNTNSYADGFFQFITPKSFSTYLSLWNLNSIDCIPFIKFPFGQLAFYHQEKYKLLNPVYNSIDIIGDKGDLDFTMNYLLCDRIALENSLFIDIYEQAFKNIGSIKYNEMYSFVPSVRLGGNRHAENVVKAQMRIEMTILSRI